ncbi:YeiH family protein [Cellulosimicrobium funkei]|uniref:Putative sulfate exporter family transporter n=1 Tax=Cellulosimicrobium funkei TaxID=264251 RepID=A0A4Y8R8R0_9MICO|nr:putative sulfate exporter family transporter [Cellulosimicrobium funkei]TFF17469.1 putative sulfate exporter family transporter [Cellulosimicrobium funkei]TGA74003.1 putative sulfate exporter family transporter [Cellulosimicrobium terreum]
MSAPTPPPAATSTTPTTDPATDPEGRGPTSGTSLEESVVQDGRNPGAGYVVAGVVVLLGLAWSVRYLEQHVPDWLAGTSLAGIAKAVEYPVYAIALGLLGNLVLTALGLRDRLSAAFRTELFIKTGLVLLGATVNLALIVSAAGPAIAQAFLLITLVFGFTWWLGGRLGIEDRLRALLASAVSICGVSAAISAAGAVQAKKEQLAYTASVVILFALPSIFVLPALAESLGLSPAVAGAWIGGNIDTTAAVTAAGALAGDEALQVAAIVKATQNALIGVVAVALTAYFAFKVERTPGASAPRVRELWTRFPKFVLGFLAASVAATVYVGAVGADASADQIAVLKSLSTVFFIVAFVSIGLEFKVTAVREAGWKPLVVFGSATVFNLVVGLALASVLFANLEV